jgi:hypothetical protein
LAHGGKRVGAGRKPGSLTTKTREIASKAAEEGITPLEVMLQNMRHFYQVALDAEETLRGLTAAEISSQVGEDATPEEQFKFLLAEVKKTAGFRQMAQDAATDAAPFIHPRLAAIDHSGTLSVSHEAALAELDDDDQ